MVNIFCFLDLNNSSIDFFFFYKHQAGSSGMLGITAEQQFQRLEFYLLFFFRGGSSGIYKKRFVLFLYHIDKYNFLQYNRTFYL
jgi:hypothetical protein